MWLLGHEKTSTHIAEAFSQDRSGGNCRIRVSFGLLPSAPPKQTGQRRHICRTLGQTGLRLLIVSMGSIYAIVLLRVAHDEGTFIFIYGN